MNKPNTVQMDIAVKTRAANDRVHPSDVVQKALELYLGLDKKGKK